MLIKSLRSLLFSAACQAASTTLYEMEQEVQTDDGVLKVRFTLDSEFYYDASVGDLQRLTTSVHVDHPNPFEDGIFTHIYHHFKLQDLDGTM